MKHERYFGLHMTIFGWKVLIIKIWQISLLPLSSKIGCPRKNVLSVGDGREKRRCSFFFFFFHSTAFPLFPVNAWLAFFSSSTTSHAVVPHTSCKRRFPPNKEEERGAITLLCIILPYFVGTTCVHQWPKGKSDISANSPCKRLWKTRTSMFLMALPIYAQIFAFLFPTQIGNTKLRQRRK